MIRILCALLATLLLAGCPQPVETGRTITLDLPKIEGTTVFTRHEIDVFLEEMRVQHGFHLQMTPTIQDGRYLRITTNEVRALIRLMHSLPVDYRSDAMDCEDYVRLFRVLAVAASGHADAAVAIGQLSVDQRHPWARVPSGGAHAVAFAVVQDPGSYPYILVIESQNGTTIPLKDYPNRRFIRTFFLLIAGDGYPAGFT